MTSAALYLQGVERHRRSSHVQGHTAADAPPGDFAAKFSGLAEDMPRLPRDSFLQGSSQVLLPVNPLQCFLVCSGSARHRQVRAQPPALG